MWILLFQRVSVQSVVLKYPYAVVATGTIILRVMDLRTGDTLHSRLFNDRGEYCVNPLHHNKTILAGNNRTCGGQNSIYFCDLRKITNPQKNGPHWRRKKLFENKNVLVKSCVNTSCVVGLEGNKLLVWDFWNCDDFSDSPDDFWVIIGKNSRYSDNPEHSDTQDIWPPLLQSQCDFCTWPQTQGNIIYGVLAARVDISSTLSSWNYLNMIVFSILPFVYVDMFYDEINFFWCPCCQYIFIFLKINKCMFKKELYFIF